MRPLIQIDHFAQRQKTGVIRPSVLSLLFFVLWPYSLCAWDYSATGATTEQSVQLRTGAEFTKKWKNGVQLGIGEDLRFDLFDQISGTTAKSVSADSTLGAAFNRSYTTLSLA